jgi:hypothetical protein
MEPVPTAAKKHSILYLFWCCYVTVVPKKNTSQNGYSTCKVFIPKTTDITEKMTKF